MTLYSKLIKKNNATTLVFRAGRLNPLTQQQLNKAICCLLQRGEVNQENFASHSFQNGTYTTVTIARLPAWSIKHWDHGIAMLTCHTSAALVLFLVTIPHILANADPTYQPPWESDL